MIGGLMARLRASTAAAAIAAGLGGLPQLGQQRTLSSRPGSGIVKCSGGRSPRRDSARQEAAQAKRERKNDKRLRDWHACLAHGIPGRWTAWPHPWEGLSHGK